jgi:hypothetical protein
VGNHRKYSPKLHLPAVTARWSSGIPEKIENLGFRSSLMLMIDANSSCSTMKFGLNVAFKCNAVKRYYGVMVEETFSLEFGRMTPF